MVAERMRCGWRRLAEIKALTDMLIFLRKLTRLPPRLLEKQRARFPDGVAHESHLQFRRTGGVGHWSRLGHGPGHGAGIRSLRRGSNSGRRKRGCAATSR